MAAIAGCGALHRALSHIYERGSVLHGVRLDNLQPPV
jgi:hypothetical protein